MACSLARKNMHPAHLVNTVVAACDWLHAGFLIISDSGQFLFANDAAAQILRMRDGLGLDLNGRLMIGQKAEISGERRIADLAVILDAARNRGGLNVSVPRPSGRLAFVLTLRPTHPDSPRLSNGGEGTVLGLIHDPERAVDAGLTGLRELYQLTMTETRLAHLIMAGKTIEECTGLLGIRRTTVKMHLRNLYGKTGVRRQSELVAVLFTSFGGVRCSKSNEGARGRLASNPMESAGPELPGEREAC